MSNQPLIPNDQEALYLFDLAGYVPSVFEKAVTIQNPAFQRPALTKLVGYFGNEGIQTTDRSGNRVFNMAVQQNDYPFATIQTRTVNGSNLDLTFTDSTFNDFAEGTTIASDTNTLGTIVSTSPGKVTISFEQNSAGTSGFVTADFAAGEGTSLMGMWGNINDRKNYTIPTSIPTKYTNVIGQFDGGCEIKYDEVYTKTYFDFQGSNCYLSGKEYIALQKYYQYYYSYMSSDFAMQLGNKPRPATWVNQIKTMGGFQKAKTGPLTLTSFKEVAKEYIINSGLKGDRIFIIAGSDYAWQIGDILTPYVLTAGVNNVVGGRDVSGMSINTYSVLSKQITLIIDPFMDNTKIFGSNSSTGYSNRSDSAIWFSPEMVQVEGGGVVPPVLDKYFGVANLLTTQEVGMIDRYGNPVSSGSNGKKSCIINYSMDRVTQITNCAMAMYHGN